MVISGPYFLLNCSSWLKSTLPQWEMSEEEEEEEVEEEKEEEEEEEEEPDERGVSNYYDEPGNALIGIQAPRYQYNLPPFTASQG